MIPKSGLRQQMLLARTQMGEAECAQKSARIAQNIQHSDLFKNAKTVLFFAAHKNEPFLLPLAEASFWYKTVCFPRVEDVHTRTLEVFAVSSLWDLQEGQYGILEPVRGEPLSPDHIDLVLVPALAIDAQGNRLGYGGGFFDRFLKNITAPKIGVVFSSQILASLPRESHDIPLDGWVTEEGIFPLRATLS